MSCYKGYYLNNSTCLIICDYSFYRDESNTCQKCSITCLQCMGPLVNQCISCAIGFNLNISNCIQMVNILKLLILFQIESL